MIPILFDKTETAFTSNGIGRLVDCISCSVTEERNGIYELELEYPSTGKWYQQMIANGGIIGVIHDDNHDIQPFDIYQSTAPIDGVVTFYAHHISYRLNNIILQPYSASTAEKAVQRIVTNSVNTNPFSFSTDKVVSATFKLEHPASVRSILFGQEGSLLDVYGTAEFKFDKFNVQMLTHRGSDTGVTVRYGKNMTEIEQTIDDSGTFNALAAYWTDGTEYVYTNPIITQPTTPISPVKPASMDVSDKFTEKPTAAQVAGFAQTYLDNNTPWFRTENIKIDFVALWQSPEYEDVAAIQRVGLCDTVSVYYTQLGIVAERVKVVRVVYDVLSERFSEMELGDLTSAYVAISDGIDPTPKFIPDYKEEYRVVLTKSSVSLTANQSNANNVDFTSEIAAAQPSGKTFKRLEFLGAWPGQTWTNAVVVRAFRSSTESDKYLELVTMQTQTYTIRAVAVYK